MTSARGEGPSVTAQFSGRFGSSTQSARVGDLARLTRCSLMPMMMSHDHGARIAVWSSAAAALHRLTVCKSLRMTWRC